MGAVAGPTNALRRLLRIAVIPGSVFWVFAVWLLNGWGGPTVMNALHVFGGLVFPAFAAASCATAAARSRGRQRQAWLVMTSGLVALQIGAIVVLYHRFWHHSAFPLYPPAAMGGFVLFPLVACVALLLFPGRYPGVARLRMLLDGTIMAASLFVVAWATLLRDVYVSQRMDTLHEVLALACPIAGVVTVTVAILVLARATAEWRQTLRVLTIGLTLIAASGGAYVFLFVRHIYLFDSFLGLGWPGGLVIIGVAALSAPPEQPEPTSE